MNEMTSAFASAFAPAFASAFAPAFAPFSESSPESFSEPRSDDDLSRSEDDLLRMRESSVIRDKGRPRGSMNRQKQLFERSSQRERSDFEVMEETFN